MVFLSVNMYYNKRIQMPAVSIPISATAQSQVIIDSNRTTVYYY
jgi:hypothetical protein